MVWRQSVAHIRRASMANGMYSSSIYFRRADRNVRSQEHNGTADNEGAATMWSDQSITAWSQSDTQWHLNEFSAITMLNTHSMSSAFRNWCEQNNLMPRLSKYLEADVKTIKQQYRTAST
eukprot:2750991-Amphidinium_carterae.1